MQTTVVIVGAGLSGLHTAYECHKRGIPYRLIEARERVGGRVLSAQSAEADYDACQAAYDLGPSWFWPGQSRILGLIEELGLQQSVFMQAAEGAAMFEDNQGVIQKNVTGLSMEGAYRLYGGMRQLVSALRHQLDDECVSTDSKMECIEFSNNTIECTVSRGDKRISSQYVVLAMPPRVALAHINFTPALSAQRIEQLNAIATWMAGHAKLVCVYDSNFWQQQGLSGDVISHRGPLQEIHDASSSDGKLHALFGFVAVAPIHRIDRQDEIKALAVTQLVRLFGDQASEPKAVILQDWSGEQFTATSRDQEIQRYHPANNIGAVRESQWNNQLIWSGSEAADYSGRNNGFLEGALEASLYALSLLKQ